MYEITDFIQKYKIQIPDEIDPEEYLKSKIADLEDILMTINSLSSLQVYRLSSIDEICYRYIITSQTRYMEGAHISTQGIYPTRLCALLDIFLQLDDENVYKSVRRIFSGRRKIVAFVGRAGSGKDYQCSLLTEKGYRKVAFADALRDIAFSCFDIPYEFGMQRYEEMKAKEDCIKVLTEDSLHELNFRQFLEYLGTQGIRKYDNDFWCNCLIKTLKETTDNICISDMRFINEYDKLKQFAEENDYELKVIFCDYPSGRYQTNNKHESARMGNYFAECGYKDLSVLTERDMNKFRQSLVK